MDLLIDWVEKEVSFQGEKITFEVYPLHNEGVLKILPYVQHFNIADKKSFSIEKFYAVIKEVKDIFPDHVRNIKGITINGQVVTIDHLSQHGQLLNLTLAIMTSLINISVPKQTEIKN